MKHPRRNNGKRFTPMGKPPMFKNGKERLLAIIGLQSEVKLIKALQLLLSVYLTFLKKQNKTKRLDIKKKNKTCRLQQSCPSPRKNSPSPPPNRRPSPPPSDLLSPASTSSFPSPPLPPTPPPSPVLSPPASPVQPFQIPLLTPPASPLPPPPPPPPAAVVVQNKSLPSGHTNADLKDSAAAALEKVNNTQKDLEPWICPVEGCTVCGTVGGVDAMINDLVDSAYQVVLAAFRQQDSTSESDESGDAQQECEPLPPQPGPSRCQSPSSAVDPLALDSLLEFLGTEPSSDYVPVGGPYENVTDEETSDGESDGNISSNSCSQFSLFTDDSTFSLDSSDEEDESGIEIIEQLLKVLSDGEDES